MADIHTILKDRTNYPDNLEITAPNGEKVLLGQFRGAFDARERYVEEQATAIAQARQELATVFQGLMTEKEQLAVQKAALESAAAARTTSGGAGGGGDDAVTRIAKLEAAIAASEQKLNELRDTTHQSVLQYVDDKFRSDLASVELPQGVTPNDVIKFAQENHIFSGKIPDLKRAVEKMQEPARRKAELEKVSQESYQRGVNEATIRGMAANSRVIPPGESPFAGKKSYGSLDEAEAAAAADPEIQGMLAGVIPAPTVTGF